VHQEDKVSRHRGGKQRGQYELSRAITLFGNINIPTGISLPIGKV